MKLKNKILSIMMAVAATMSLVSISALAAAPSVNLTTDATTVKPGDTITVSVNIADNPGVCSTILSLSSDAELKLTGVTNGAIWGGATFDSDYKNPYQLTWFQDDTFATDDADNGVAATLTYTVAETAVAGATYSINLVCDTGNTFNAAFDSIDFGSYTLNITIASDKPASSTVTGVAGKTLTGLDDGYKTFSAPAYVTMPNATDGAIVVKKSRSDRELRHELVKGVAGGKAKILPIVSYKLGENDVLAGDVFTITVTSGETTVQTITYPVPSAE